MSDKKIVVSKKFDIMAEEFKNIKKQMLESDKKGYEILEKKTKKEKEVLIKAYENYNKKVKEIVGGDKEYIKIHNETKQLSEKMLKTLNKAKNEFNDIYKKLMNKKDLSKEQKEKRVNTLYNYIINKLYTKDEIEYFNHSIGNILYIKDSE